MMTDQQSAPRMPRDKTHPPSTMYSTKLVDFSVAPQITSNPDSSKRKRVRFDEDEDNRTAKRQVVEASQLSTNEGTSHADVSEESEKGELWMTKEEYQETLKSILNDIVEARSLRQDSDHESSQSSCYTEAMAQTYSLCCSPNVNGTISLENVAMLSLLDSSFRGLESHTLPRKMRNDRKTRKAKTVSRVLELQGELKVASNPKEDATECLRLVSEYFSEPSRKFARALGEIDRTYAHLAGLPSPFC